MEGAESDIVEKEWTPNEILSKKSSNDDKVHTAQYLGKPPDVSCHP